MKKSLISFTLLTLVLIGCKKKDDNPTPSNSDKAVLTVTKNTDQTLTVHVDYTDKNVGSVYTDDAIRLYINDTFTKYHFVDPKNVDCTFTFNEKYTGSKYTVYLERYITTGTGSETVTSISGN